MWQIITDPWSSRKADEKMARIYGSNREKDKYKAGKEAMKTGTRLGIAALALAVGTVICEKPP